ncbi:MmgE/PrpD family protein [Chloroflexota bacterium]
MDASQILAEHATRLQWKDIPTKVVDITKDSILDTLAVTIGASSMSPALKMIAELAKEIEGKTESTILAFGYKVPAFMAAFANGAMSHYLDYDDEHYPQKLHPSAAVISAAFPVAQRIGSVNGKDFILAVALGQDITARIGLAAVWNLPARPLWQMSQLCGSFGAAITSGKLMGLDAPRLVDSMGIAFCQAAGTQELRYGVNTELGAMYPAFSAKGGVLSAIMAEKGVSGIKTSFEGKAGFFKTYFNMEHNRDALVGGLGSRFENLNIGFKPHPACGSSHVHIDATIGIIEENNISPEDIEGIHVFVDGYALSLCEPIGARRRPATIGDAKYSIPYGVAVAATCGKVLNKNYTPDAIRNEVVLDMAQRVTCEFSPQLKVARALEEAAGIVEIRTKKGQTYSRRENVPYGHPKKPLKTEDLVNKFLDCASYSIKPIPDNNIKKVIDLVQNLEDVNNVCQIAELLA